MSHWIKTQTKMKEIKYIKDGLKSLLGTEAEVGQGLKIKGGWNSSNLTEDVDIRINEGVGLRQNKDGSWEIVGDFYNTKHRQFYGKEEQFIEQLQGKYCVAQAKDRITGLPGGFTFTDNDAGEVDEDGYIIMRAQSFFDS